MRIAVIGAGAVGGYYGGALARAGEEVALIERGPQRDAIGRDGLRVQSNWGDFTVHPQVTADPEEVGPVDLVLYCVKLYHNPGALPLIGPMLKDDTVVLTIQNGVDGADQIAAVYGWEHAVGGATYIETGRTGPGQIRQTGPMARIAFGEQDGSRTERTARVARILEVKGIQPVVVDDIRAALWSKLIYVAAIGTVMTAARGSLLEVLECPVGEYTLRTVMEEIEAVARARGIDVAPDVVDRELAEGLEVAADAQASLQDDFRAGHPLELDSLLGSVVRQGRDAGVPVPASAALYTSLFRFRDGSAAE